MLSLAGRGALGDRDESSGSLPAAAAASSVTYVHKAPAVPMAECASQEMGPLRGACRAGVGDAGAPSLPDPPHQHPSHPREPSSPLDLQTGLAFYWLAFYLPAIMGELALHLSGPSPRYHELTPLFIHPPTLPPAIVSCELVF